jgi:hypothetical protein
MKMCNYSYKLLQIGQILILNTLLLAGCFSGSDSDSTPSISIEVPTSEPTYSTTLTGLRLGGTISGASFAHVENTVTGSSFLGYVFYNEGHGTWFADVSGLTFGENPLVVIADKDGSGTSTASAYISVVRPLVPLDLIINGSNQFSASTFWNDAHSIADSHKIAIFEDGTGKSTTGSLLSEYAGDVVDITWTMLSPDSIQIINCPTCSFQKISRISGSLDEGVFYGEIETVGGDSDFAIHAFVLNSGVL